MLSKLDNQWNRTVRMKYVQMLHFWSMGTFPVVRAQHYKSTAFHKQLKIQVTNLTSRDKKTWH